MGLRVVGAGFGRTGTLSLKAALEQLLGGACYHMAEVFGHPDHVDGWLAAADGDAGALAPVLEPYVATVDWPACAFWRELAGANPDALVLLSVRPAERWYESFEATIGAALARPLPPDAPPPVAAVFALSDRVVVERSLGGHRAGREQLLGAYERHNAEVRAGVEPDRLLEFDVAEGWGPLCDRLGVDVPDEPFPNLNDRASFGNLLAALGP